MMAVEPCVDGPCGARGIFSAMSTGRVHPCVRPVRAAPHGCWPWWTPRIASLITSLRSRRSAPLGLCDPRS